MRGRPGNDGLSEPTASQSAVCEHGVSARDGRYDGTWAAPFSTCGCCGVLFPYIDSGWVNDKGMGGRSWTKDRCGNCGGHYTEWGGKP